MSAYRMEVNPAMIPTTADDATLARYVSNILAAWDATSEANKEAGRQWYPVAHSLAERLGGGDVRMGAGLLAALSPQKRWNTNVALAWDAASGDVHGHTGDTLGKVRAILAGIDPVDVLPSDAKTGHFYRNILDPTDPDPVTVDRHAHDIAVGETYGGRDRGLGNRTRYATLAHAWREAARQRGILPNVMQAATWEAYRRQVSNTSTRGNLAA